MHLPPLARPARAKPRRRIELRGRRGGEHAEDLAGAARAVEEAVALRGDLERKADGALLVDLEGARGQARGERELEREAQRALVRAGAALRPERELRGDERDGGLARLVVDLGPAADEHRARGREFAACAASAREAAR
jgi:hypothetical protein